MSSDRPCRRPSTTTKINKSYIAVDKFDLYVDARLYAYKMSGSVMHFPT
jgi:hypothetical protein